MEISLLAGCYSSSRHLSFCVDLSARYLLHDLLCCVSRLLCLPFEHAVSNAGYIVVVQVSVLRAPFINVQVEAV
jgi:hypothetical protein